MCEHLSLQKIECTHIQMFILKQLEPTQNIENQVHIWGEKSSCILGTFSFSVLALHFPLSVYLHLNSSIESYANSAPPSSASTSNGASGCHGDKVFWYSLTSKKNVFSLFFTSVHHEVGLAMGYGEKGKRWRKCQCIKTLSETVSAHTNELCHGVVFSLCANRSCDAVVLQDGEEELNKVRCVGWCDHIQHLGRRFHLL